MQEYIMKGLKIAFVEVGINEASIIAYNLGK